MSNNISGNFSIKAYIGQALETIQSISKAAIEACSMMRLSEAKRSSSRIGKSGLNNDIDQCSHAKSLSALSFEEKRADEIGSKFDSIHQEILNIHDFLNNSSRTSGMDIKISLKSALKTKEKFDKIKKFYQEKCNQNPEYSDTRYSEMIELYDSYLDNLPEKFFIIEFSSKILSKAQTLRDDTSSILSNTKYGELFDFTIPAGQTAEDVANNFICALSTYNRGDKKFEGKILDESREAGIIALKDAFEKTPQMKEALIDLITKLSDEKGGKVHLSPPLIEGIKMINAQKAQKAQSDAANKMANDMVNNLCVTGMGVNKKLDLNKLEALLNDDLVKNSPSLQKALLRAGKRVQQNNIFQAQINVYMAVSPSPASKDQFIRKIEELRKAKNPESLSGIDGVKKIALSAGLEFPEISSVRFTKAENNLKSQEDLLKSLNEIEKKNNSKILRLGIASRRALSQFFNTNT